MFELYFEFILGFSIGLEHISSPLEDEEYDYLILLNLGFCRLMLFKKA